MHVLTFLSLSEFGINHRMRPDFHWNGSSFPTVNIIIKAAYDVLELRVIFLIISNFDYYTAVRFFLLILVDCQFFKSFGILYCNIIGAAVSA